MILPTSTARPFFLPSWAAPHLQPAYSAGGQNQDFANASTKCPHTLGIFFLGVSNHF
jgi:hypothetical protein